MGLLASTTENGLLLAISYGLVILFLYLAATAIYNLYFHPLVKYPGPLLAKISFWPSYYHTLKGDRHIWLWQCQQIYGSIFRYSPNGVLMNTPTGLRSIYENSANVEKADYYKTYPKKNLVLNTWSLIDKDIHSRHRRVLNNVFSEKALRSSEEFVIQNVDRWCELLVGTQGGWSESRNIAQWINCLVFDILGDLCYGKAFGTKEPGENEWRCIPDLIATSLRIDHPLANAPFLPLWLWLKPRGLDNAFAALVPAAVKRYRKFIMASVDERIQKEEQQISNEEKGEKRKDMFHYLFEAKEKMTNEQLQSEADLLTIAGSDTTSTVFAAMFFYLTRNPEAYRKLAQEIRSAFGSVDEIRWGSKLTACRYLRAFIDETMRMSPPVPADLPRKVLPRGIHIDGAFLPASTTLGASAYVIQHNPEYFPEPFTFRPERWIVDEKASVSAESVALAESAFAPFSMGKRGCVGKNLAYLEMSVTMARVLWRFDVRGVEGDTLGAGNKGMIWGRRDAGQYQLEDAFIALRDGPMVQVRRREL